jgi:membrane-bound acyltransferase YfiQ involved in biofilm formation
MNDLLLLIYPALLILLVFWKARIPGRGSGNDGFLCLEHTRMIQAGACLGVILHHLTQEITFYGSGDRGPITVFSFMGILFTSLFFFFSGYGLITSVYSRQDYLRKFLYTRLPTVLIPFWVTNALGVLLHRLAYGVHWDLSGTWQRIFGITLINSNGWFIVEIVVLYLIFYVLFSLIRNRDIALSLLCVVTFILMLYSSHQGHDLPGAKVHWFRGEWWYNSTSVFLFGIMFARFRKTITSFFRKHYAVLTVLFAVLTIVTLLISIYCVRPYDIIGMIALRASAAQLHSYPRQQPALPLRCLCSSST